MGGAEGSRYVMRMFRGRTAILCALALACVRCGAPIPEGEPMDAGDDGDPSPADGGLPPDSGTPPDDGGSDAGVDAPPDDGGTDAGVVTGIRLGDEVSATADVNLRTGPGTTNAVVLVIPR